MKKQPKHEKKLPLKNERVRRLDPVDLKAVNGGWPIISNCTLCSFITNPQDH